MHPGLCVLLAFLVLVAGCSPPTSKSAARDLPPVTVLASADAELTVGILELFCQTCAERIIAGCRGIEGIARVDVDRTANLLTLHFDSSRTTRERVLAAIDDVVASIP